MAAWCFARNNDLWLVLVNLPVYLIFIGFYDFLVVKSRRAANSHYPILFPIAVIII